MSFKEVLDTNQIWWRRRANFSHFTTFTFMLKLPIYKPTADYLTTYTFVTIYLKLNLLLKKIMIFGGARFPHCSILLVLFL